MERARNLATRFGEIADSIEGDAAALEAVLAEAATEAVVSGPEFVRHALMMFMTHHSKGRRLKVQSLEERSPTKVLPSPKPPATALADPEKQLDWFREDAKANEHHEHWHVVYPTQGLFNANPPRLNDRHGELFFYMHQQMLARYDTERLAAGLPKAAPLNDYAAPIKAGYDPGPGLTERPGPGSSQPFAARQPNSTLKDIAGFPVLRHQNIKQSLETAIDTGQFNNGKPVTAQSLGETEEPTFKRTDASYGNHHGGHILIAYVNATAANQTPGVMIDTATAIRDPVFWRWHRHVDDLNFRWQEKQNANDFSDAPPVLIRKSLHGAATENQSPDIILAFQNRIVDQNGNPVDGQAFGEAMFGGDANWNTDFSASNFTTDVLETAMETRDIELANGAKVPVEYLDQKEFGYFIRVENLAGAKTEVTVRIFLVADAPDYADNRRMWIEMDKFQRTLQPRQKAVLYQPAEMSSVIRKPGVKPPGSKIETPNAPGTPDNDLENFCSCGWGYNLLLPRGTAQGMRFRLFVMLTDWAKDQVQQSKCGSMSFCGAKNIYPDVQGMGYPFDRKFPNNNSIADTIKAQNNMATRDFTIRDVT
ncbi:MAG TPA: tyrosinase family protein [Pyrinomonadaceae bacterium]|nr:tyrosinase family protein [Pyrinomonadaceae bacterium]